ncbi:O-methyltransferase [Exiguobacterium sp. s146]|uniref:O-methyltransferase n=1 Tax=Exiguobacterium sp. s146 TaxID=2751223 RepID=UPI001BEAE746
MEHSSYEGYVENLVTPRSPLLAEMEAFAKEHHVPIMDLTGSEVLLSLLALQRPTRILEVGTAIGYSAIRMAELLPDAEIVTIERNARRHEEALGFIGRSDVSDRITVIHGDAVELIGTIEGEFDAVFIDAAKGQYQKFFDGYGALVPIGGTIYSDNLFLRGDVLLDDMSVLDRRRRRLVRLVKEFTEQLMARTDYHTAILPLGDGLAISRKLR